MLIRLSGSESTKIRGV